VSSVRCEMHLCVREYQAARVESEIWFYPVNPAIAPST